MGGGAETKSHYTCFVIAAEIYLRKLLYYCKENEICQAV
jgi:hypothetical protein